MSASVRPVTRIFRAMRKDDRGHPVCGSEPNQLGGRLGVDVPEAIDELVETETGGMSATPDDPKLLPIYKRPKWLGGAGKLPVFEIEVAVLDVRLRVRRDPENPERHAFVEPAAAMTVNDYQAVLCATRRLWREVLK